MHFSERRLNAKLRVENLALHCCDAYHQHIRSYSNELLLFIKYVKN